LLPADQPHDCLTAQQAAEAWQEFVAEVSRLNSRHRTVLQIAAVLRVRPDIGVAALAAYSAVLSKPGASLADESRVAMT